MAEATTLPPFLFTDETLSYNPLIYKLLETFASNRRFAETKRRKNFAKRRFGTHESAFGQSGCESVVYLLRIFFS